MKAREMPWNRTIVLAALLLGPGIASMAEGQCPVVSGSTGVDGPLTPTTNTMVQDDDDDGFFNFTTVNIPTNVTVTFERNTRNKPIVILASGNVTINQNGGIDLRGENAQVENSGRGGPGGFDGGAGGVACGGPGLGPRGGAAACGSTSNGGIGGSGLLNSELIPLVGGSGGGGAAGVTGFGSGGGGGGGAILIASSGTLTLNGTVDVRGGAGHNPTGGSFRVGGSGGSGAARLVATVVAGSTAGRIIGAGGRLEACSGQFNGSGVSSFSPLPSPVIIADLPLLSIASVAGTGIPTQPNGSFDGEPDVSLPEGTTEAQVMLTASGIPPDTQVNVKVTPKNGAGSTVQSEPLAGSVESSTAMATITLNPGRSIITAE